jgi:hypothetical protein
VANGGTAGASAVLNRQHDPVERSMAENQKPTPVEASCGARVASVAAGTALVWRAFGVPRLGPAVLGLGGLALIWHGLAGPSPRAETARVHAKVRDAVHRASEDSFPASDPPSWTPTNGPARRQ